MQRYVDTVQKEGKGATTTRFDLSQVFHQAVIDKVGNEQETLEKRKRPIQSTTRNLILLKLNRKENLPNLYREFQLMQEKFDQ